MPTSPRHWQDIQRNVIPDRIDLRDRPYMPAVAVKPAPELLPAFDPPVLDQGVTRACTGFALASVLYSVLRAAKRSEEEARVSPFMLYAMARRYDEYDDDPELDVGSSVRGAIRGWYRHGACSAPLWPQMPIPALTSGRDNSPDWWQDAVRRPLGAYYRVDTKSVTDMQIALNEVGALYVSAELHEGWRAGFNQRKPANGIWRIVPQQPNAGAHAFAIIGYTSAGFIVHNSFGTRWGTDGRAILTYDDWLDNAMDCWVAQIGVVTEQREAIAASPSLRMQQGRVSLASEPSLALREVDPFIVDMGNNGLLSRYGQFRTDEQDLVDLMTNHLERFIEAWHIAPRNRLDIAIYAHGGLVSEAAAAETAARWVPRLYESGVFPIFLMLESDIMSTLKNQLADMVHGRLEPAAGFWDPARRWYNERIERLLAKPGTALWDEMKENADGVTANQDGGGNLLRQAWEGSRVLRRHMAGNHVRIHLIGHSAGAILHSQLIDRFAPTGWRFATTTFMAPALRTDHFAQRILPWIRNGVVGRYNQFHLSDHYESTDTSCRPLLFYGRSLLYLVSQAFEGGIPTPIVGMEKYWNSAEVDGTDNVRSFAAPGPATRCTQHGHFDEDEATIRSVIGLIREEAQ